MSAILVENNSANKAYVNSKIKDCAEVGFESSLYKFLARLLKQGFRKKIAELNDPNVDGFIVQLPFTKTNGSEKNYGN